MAEVVTNQRGEMGIAPTEGSGSPVRLRRFHVEYGQFTKALLEHARNEAEKASSTDQGADAA